MPVLGASTRHYRAYGKRTTNVVNKRANLGEPAWAIESDSSGDSSQDDHDDRATALANQRSEKLAPIVVGHTVSKPPLSKPKLKSKTAATAAASEEAKENLVVTSGRPAKATNKPDKSALQSARRRAPLGPKRTVQKPQVADPRPACPDKPEDPDSSIDSSPVSAAPKRRTARKRVVVAVEEEEESSDSSPSPGSFATPPGTPSPVVSDLSFESSGSSVQADASLSGSTASSLIREPSKVVFADELAAERVPEKDVDESSSAARDDFATRRRSRRSTAAATTTSSSSTHSTSRRRLPSPSVHPVPTELAPLLPHLLSPTIYNFTSFVSAPLAPLASVSTATRSASAAWWTKIGEASYSEVFATTAAAAAAAAEEEDGRARDEVVVVKVIPIADPRPLPPRGAAVATSGTGEEELPFLSDWSAIQREIVTSRTLGGQDTAVPGFVRFKGAFLVQGSYPEELLASWDDYKEKQSPPSDEQIRPHVFTSTQLYALILLENAGTDLEAYKLKTWREAASVFAQAADALGRAERACGFEHRDLHWGNLLLQPTSHARRANPRRAHTELAADEATRAVRSLNLVSSTVPLSPALSGITATLIDFTLSRCVVDNSDDAEGEAVFDSFEDGEIFEGTGDEQFDVYRRMREVVETEGGEWAAAHPRTNVLWLHYLVRKLLVAKRLKPPPATATINTTPDSPRAVPSPRKLPFPRRHTMAGASAAAAGPCSPPPPAHRRPRTQPGTMLPGGRKAVLLEREHETERRAYAWLKAVADELDRLVEQVWRLDGRLKRGKASTSAASKHARRAQNVDFSGVTCASDLAQALFSA